MFSMEKAWIDTVAMARAHREGSVAIAGIFAFLPSLAYNLFVPPIELESGTDSAALLGAHLATWWPAMLAMVLLSLFGGLAVLTLALSQAPVTVGRALSTAVRLWPTAVAFFFLCVLAGFVVTLIASLVVTIIAIALFGRSSLAAILSLVALVPAVYLIGRTVVGNALIVADDERSPLRAFSASLAMTKGSAWQVSLMYVSVFIVYVVVLIAATALIGIAVSLVAPAAVHFVQALIASGLASAMSVLTFLLSAAVFRQLNAR